MKNAALILVAVALAVLFIQGFSWVWLTLAIVGAVVLALKGLKDGGDRLFKSG
jgi:hypothetical protein